MFKAVKKYQKGIMAFFAVGLMITFVASIGNTPGGNKFRDPVIGTIGDGEKLHLSDLQNARHAYDRLKRTGILHINPMDPNEPVSPLVLLATHSPTYARSYGRVVIPVELIDKDPDIFLALVREAESLGLTASEDDVQELMRNLTPQSTPRTPEDTEDLRFAFACLLKVKAAYERASSVIKVSAPQRQVEAAELAQEMKVHFVEFNTAEFNAAVPAPKPEQLTKQFDTFANFAADQVVEDSNPFGFGYRYPNRIKLEFISVLHEQLKDAVRKSKDDATWEIEARKVYLRNPQAYPATKPADTQEANATTKPTTAPTTAPTTRPLVFADYRKEILDRLIDDEADKLGEQVRKRIVSTMEQDYNAYRTAVGNAATQPTSRPAGPTSSVGVPYGSDQYLAALAQQIQSEFKLLPVAMTVNKDWQTTKDLAGLPGIGQAELRRNIYSQGVKFPDLAMTFVEAFGHESSGRDLSPTLSMLQPSPVLGDEQENMHIYRLTGADPAHAAKEMAPFAEQVEKDYRTAEALKLARAEADKLAASAKQQGLETATKATGRKFQLSSRITAGGIAEGNLNLKVDSQKTLIKAVLDLLKDPDAVKADRAIATVDLPRDGKVLVISLAEVKSTQQGRPFYATEATVGRWVAQQREDYLLSDWYNVENITKRTRLNLESKKQKPDQG